MAYTYIASRSYVNSFATQIEIDFGSPTHLTWVDLKFLPPQQHEIVKWNSVAVPRLGQPTLLDLFSSAIPDSGTRIGIRMRIRCSKDRSARLLSAVANVNWPFGQNRTGYRLHFNFPLPHPLPQDECRWFSWRDWQTLRHRSRFPIYIKSCLHSLKRISNVLLMGFKLNKGLSC